MTAFALKIVTPDGLKYDGMAEELIVRSTTGDIGIMAGHINCVVPLGMGQAMAIIDGNKRYAACIGGMLSVIDGEINMLGKARGSKMGNNLLVQEINKAGGIDFSKPVLLGYSGISDALLRKYIEDSRNIWEGNLREVRYTSVGSVIGTHAGPGAVVVAFFKN